MVEKDIPAFIFSLLFCPQNSDFVGRANVPTLYNSRFPAFLAGKVAQFWPMGCRQKSSREFSERLAFLMQAPPLPPFIHLATVRKGQKTKTLSPTSPYC